MTSLRALAALSVFALSFPVSAAGGTLALTAEGIAPGSVPQGAGRVELLRITLEASCDADVRLDTVTVRHEGLGDAADIDRVYLTDGRRRVSRAAGFSGNDKTAGLRLTGYTVPRCAERTLSVLADFSASAASGGEHRIVLGSSDAVVSDAAETSLTAIAGSAPARATPANSGTINVEYLPLNRTLRYGADRVVSRLRLDADGGADHVLRSLTLTNDGSARNTDLRNLYLEISGKRVTPKAGALDGDAVTLTFDPPVLLGRNASRVLELHADIRASSRRTIRFVLEEPSDLDAAIQKQRGVQFQ